ncbi:hypothetical protein HanRHA438_Chr16g0777241 [Helianthus annuus]|nr:hypothetical protein HanRHA438_Chr16g0777241 [Helianthus annuus]
MFLYVNMFNICSICSDMSDMFCTHLVMFPIMYQVNHASDYVQYPIMFCISYVCFDSVSLYQFRLSMSLNLDFDSVLYVYFVSASTCISYVCFDSVSLIQFLFYTCR